MPDATRPAQTLTDVLFEKVGRGLCLLGSDGTVVRANAEWLRSTGFSEEQVLRQNIVDLLPVTRDLALAMLVRARAGHRVEVPRQARLVNGRELWWEGSIEPVAMDGGTGLLISAREIGASEPSQEPLRDSEQSRRQAADIQAVLDAVPAAVFIARDPEARRIDANRAGLEMLRAAPGANTSMSAPGAGALPYRVLRGGLEVPASELPAQRAARGEEVRDWDCEIRFEDGTSRHFLGYATPLRDDAGNPAGSVTALVDITERKRAEQELDRTRNVLAEAQKIAHLGSFEYVAATRTTVWSEEEYRIYGLDPEGPSPVYEVMLAECFPRDDAALLHETFSKAMRSRSIYELEHRIVRPDGAVRWVYDRAHPYFDESGKLLRYVGATLDITERKRAEEALRESERQYRSLAENAPEVIARFDRQMRHTYLNDYGSRVYGIPVADVLGRTSAELGMPPDKVAQWKGALDEVLDTGDQRTVEFDFESATFGKQSFSSLFVPEKNDAGEVVSILAITRDVTAAKRTEEALRLANEQLRQADRRKNEFLGMLSHELRNPLAPISNSSYILRHAEPGSEQARRAQAVISRQTEHLTRLVDDLLDVTRIARGKIELRRDRVDLRDVVWRAADDFRLLMRARGVQFDVVVPREQIWAEADATRITQLVGNLLHNASKFTRNGDTVTLSMEVTGPVAEIRVRDTGAGIEEALLPRVFEPFVQGERTLARTEGGLGLGLALVKGIAELHGGTVRAGSPGNGKGAEFIVRLRLGTAAATEEVATAHVQPRHGSRRVLVVEDNEDTAESLADIIGMLGHTVEIAHDGPSAVEKARANVPDVVLCDIGLPGMTGYEVAKALRDAGTRAQLFAVTGYARPEDVSRAVEAGFDGHIAKPCRPEQIERLLA